MPRASAVFVRLPPQAASARRMVRCSTGHKPPAHRLETACRSGHELSFLEYLKVGIPLTFLILLAGIGCLTLTAY